MTLLVFFFAADNWPPPIHSASPWWECVVPASMDYVPRAG